MKLISQALSILKRIFPLVWLARLVSKLSRKISYAAHWLQFNVEWGVDNPEYFDHQMDLYFKWIKSGDPLPMERGVHSLLALRGGGLTLDLACGDGFFSNYFYASKSREVIGIDFDKSAIATANTGKILDNTNFILGDIRSDIPSGPFDNVVWDAAIQHFTEEEISSIMSRIKQVMKKDAVLSGYTVVRSQTGNKHIVQHEYEFENKADLERFLTPYFQNTHVYETATPSRTSLYFYATDGELPMDWKMHSIRRAGERKVIQQ